MLWLITVAALMASSTGAATFNNLWEYRIEQPIMPEADEAMQWFDTLKAPKQKAKTTIKKSEKEPECLTKQQARKKWPDSYLSWRGNHCWFRKERHKKHERQQTK
jgi:hypothetical protein